MRIFLLSLLTVLSISTMPINCTAPVSDDNTVSVYSDINELEIQNNSNNEKETP